MFMPYGLQADGMHWQMLLPYDVVVDGTTTLSQPTYNSIPTDPTTKYKNTVITLLKTIKAESWINEAIYRRLYPTGAGSL